MTFLIGLPKANKRKSETLLEAPTFSMICHPYILTRLLFMNFEYLTKQVLRWYNYHFYAFWLLST